MRHGQMMVSRKFLGAAALALLALLSACTINPATGRSSFTGLMSESDELRIGRENHPKVLEEFGGAYPDPELQAYVDSIGKFLASTSERPNLDYHFTVLNSPIVNAFAVPGGYIYITRGLLGLANSEAEVAGVLAHEIGHIAARHSAERYSQSVLAQIAVIGVGVGTGSGDLMNAAGAGAMTYLQSYSRDQEFEADKLGVRYLGRATYDPTAMASFLASLQAESRLGAALAGDPGAADDFNIMQTHPRTADRVQRAIAEASGTTGAADPIVERDLYFDKIDGILYGDDPEQGFIQDLRFAHPKLGFEFRVPSGFHLFNSAQAVLARGPGKSQIVFDAAPKPWNGAMTAYIAQGWGKELQIENLQSLNIDGMEAATGTAFVRTRGGPADLRLVAIRWDQRTIYRFLFIANPEAVTRLDPSFRDTAFSFRRLSAGEISQLKPQRLRIITVATGDTVESLARRMPFSSFQVERFRVLNGLSEGQQLQPGQRVKIIVQ